jgi:tetratricopeptide (TPR) repeat protein
MRSFLALSLVLALAPSAWAEDRAAARAAYLRGTQHYDLSEYDQALESFKEAYRNFEEPTFLFNIAQCYRQLGNHEKALRFYRTYLIKMPNAPNREEVRQLIAQLNRAIEEEKQSRAMPPPSPMKPAAPMPEPATTAAPVAPPTPAVQATDRARARRKIVAGAVTAGFGVAALAVGGACLGLAKATSDSLSADDAARREFDPEAEQRGKTYDLLGGVFLGVGAAALVVGGTVAIVGVRERRPRTLTVVPAFTPQLAGVAVHGAF